MNICWNMNYPLDWGLLEHLCPARDSCGNNNIATTILSMLRPRISILLVNIHQSIKIRDINRLCDPLFDSSCCPLGENKWRNGQSIHECEQLYHAYIASLLPFIGAWCVVTHQNNKYLDAICLYCPFCGHSSCPLGYFGGVLKIVSSSLKTASTDKINRPF